MSTETYDVDKREGGRGGGRREEGIRGRKEGARRREEGVGVGREEGEGGKRG